MGTKDFEHNGSVAWRSAAGMRPAAAHDSDASSADGPRVVTTGGKNAAPIAPTAGKAPSGVDLDTGEPVDMYLHSYGVEVVRHMVPMDGASPQLAHVDALAFTVIPPVAHRPWAWLIEALEPVLPVTDLKGGRGCFGFQESLRFGQGAGLIAWGGNSQRGRLYFSIQGQGCSLVHDWAAMAHWLAEHNAKIKRIDLAHDDFDGATVSIAWARSQYESDGFNAGGRQPTHCTFGGWLNDGGSADGLTLGIGSRKNGKYCRIYEKGKQLGDPGSPWARVEVEWRSQDRIIPLDVLTNPGGYLAGAYPCLAFLAGEQVRIKTDGKAGQISYEAAINHLRQHGGKLINLMMQVCGGNASLVVEQLRRDGVPDRVAPYSHLLRDGDASANPARSASRDGRAGQA